MSEIVFQEIALLLLGAAAIGLIGSVLRQPAIVSFIAVGIVAAAFVDKSHETANQIRFLAELGIALLLFLVGLKLDWRLVKTLGPVALATGIGQVVFTAGIGFLIGLALGFNWLTSLYIATALTFSSTIIVVKLLSDKRELETLHGRIALGFLIVQDIIVVIAMVILSTIGIGVAEGGSGLADLGIVLGSLVAVIVILILFVRYVADPLMARLARTPELLVIASIGWAATAAAIGEAVGLGKELGGLAAGVSIGSTPYRDMVSARLSALRDFLLLFFFSCPSARRWIFFHPWPGLHIRRHLFRVRADRQSADRHSHHGPDGLPRPYRFLRRPDGGADFRVLAHLHGHGPEPRPCRPVRNRAGHARRSRDDRAFRLHDHLFAAALRLVQAPAAADRFRSLAGGGSRG
ncbi:cation:proton antiporter [Roseibium salinum]|nr:cation:proton antiporter [Roseibium salinum]